MSSQQETTLSLSSNGSYQHRQHEEDQPHSSFTNFQILGKSFQHLDHLSLLQQPIRQVSIGFGHVMILCENGKLYCFGRNDCGQLNLSIESNPSNSNIYGDTLDIMKLRHCLGPTTTTRVRVENNTGNNTGNNNDNTLPSLSIRSVHCGALHTMILCENNIIYACGSNSNGQISMPAQVALACGSEIEKFTRVDLSSCPLLQMPFSSMNATTTPMNRIKKLHCRFSHSGILSENGELYCCGRNYDLELGIPKEDKVLKFTQVLNIPKMKHFDFAWKYMVAISVDNVIYSSKYGILKTVRDENGNEFFCRYEKSTPNSFGDIIKLECGNEHTMFLNSRHELYGFGYSVDGQIGVNSVVKEVIRIALNQLKYDVIHDFTCAYNQSCIITKKGYLYVSGLWDFTGLSANHDDEDPEANQVILNYQKQKPPVNVFQFTKLPIPKKRFNSISMGNEIAFLFHRYDNEYEYEKQLKSKLFYQLKHYNSITNHSNSEEHPHSLFDIVMITHV
ncbi:hypothetical protein C9374_008546 [Naegleria lovaniensis]|uniref:Uncharacterized protein n=1 Tax=Naegleria lovaniensis TaxID=51637 RepID=A0AA88KI13_NAELO|nr:uncharacterized protein C9374_008546 [Naegleria lovaniensis]KAG2378403.1 hypothetical protein C9374_008546 [Naegleria lovaniensis]